MTRVLHPWRCKQGHENRTLIPVEAREGPPERAVLWCAEDDCFEHTAIFLGTSVALLPAAGRLHWRAPRP
jgi:hypothetical protein